MITARPHVKPDPTPEVFLDQAADDKVEVWLKHGSLSLRILTISEHGITREDVRGPYSGIALDDQGRVVLVGEAEPREQPSGIPPEVVKPIAEWAEACLAGRLAITDRFLVFGGKVVTYGDAKRLVEAYQASIRGEQLRAFASEAAKEIAGYECAEMWMKKYEAAVLSLRDETARADSAEAEAERLREEFESLKAELDNARELGRDRNRLRVLYYAAGPIIEHLQRNADVDWSKLDRGAIDRFLMAFSEVKGAAQ